MGIQRRDQQGEGIHLGFAQGSVVADQRRHGDAAGAGADHVQVGAAGDGEHHVDGFLQRLDISRQAPLAMHLAGIAPADHEGLHAVLDDELRHALLGREVEHVVLVDLRRHHQQRALLHLGGHRLVLDQLQHFAAEHHGALGDGQVAADFEGALLHLAGHAAIVDQVLQQIGNAVQRALAAGFEEATEGFRVDDAVGRRQGVGHQADHELAALGVVVGEIAGAQPVIQLLAPGQVGLQVAAVQRALLPGRVGEALVAFLGLQLRAAEEDAGQLQAQGSGMLCAVHRLFQGLHKHLANCAEQVAPTWADDRIETQGVFGCLLREFLVCLGHG
ncbi:hypothetical protein D9M71_364730 [compost metagenome]